MPKHRAVYLERGFFFSLFLLHRQGGGRQLARSSLPSGDTCSHDVTLLISTSARFRAVPHASQHALFARNSRWEIPGDVTHPLNLHGFPCRPARGHRPGNPLRAFREQNTRHAACGASHTGSHVDPRLPNSNNTRRHFSRPRGLVESHAERFRAGLPPRRRARESRSLNAERAPYATSRETGAVATIT